MKNRYVTSLPENYSVVRYLNAKQLRFGILMNVVASLVMIVVLAVAMPLIGWQNILADMEKDLGRTSLILLGFLVSMIAYIVLHELVHGLVYRLMTGHKLTFGLSWSCAYCGVPDIFVYRRTALLALLAPFVVFTILLVPLTILLGIYAPFAGLFAAILLGLHLGGCSGDLYATGLLLFCYRSNELLMRDTGPEQTFYMPSAAPDNAASAPADPTSAPADAPAAETETSADAAASVTPGAEKSPAAAAPEKTTPTDNSGAAPTDENR